MSDYQKQIKQHQIEMEQLEKQLPKLTTAAKEAKSLYEQTSLRGACRGNP